MSGRAGQTGSIILAWGAAVTVVVIGAVVYEFGIYSYERQVVQPVDPPAESAVPEQPETPVDTAIAAVQPPTIDTFRLDPDGSLLVAGHTQPDSETMVMIDRVPLGTVVPDADGQFVAFYSLPPRDAARVLTLNMYPANGGDAVPSRDEIIIAPMQSRAEAAQGNTSQSDTQSEATENPEPGAQAVLLADESGVRVLQPAVPGDQPPEVMSSVALDAITYTDTGEVALSGRGQGQGFVRVYLNNAPVITSQIEEGGNWRTELPQVDTGVYTLRIDELGTDGAVTSRVETPFKREDQGIVAQSNATSATQTTVSAVTVQPGSTLWAISREVYGDGVMYVRVFEANRDRIRNPDLIYPGQVFSLPE